LPDHLNQHKRQQEMTSQSSLTAFSYCEKRISAVPLWLIPLLGLLVLHCTTFFTVYQNADFMDNDTLMRLARVRFVLASGSWHGGFFPRDNAPYGMVLHWTMLFDLPIIVLTGLLSLVMSFERALHFAGMSTGPLFDYGVLLAAWWVPAPVFTPPVRQFACYIVLVSPPLLAYSAVGRSNYHIALVLLALLLGGFVLRVWCNPRRVWPAIAGGITAGFCIWLSVELLVVAVGPAMITVSLLWLRAGRERAAQSLAFAAAFAVVTTAALLIDPPYAGFGAVELDRLSAPYVCLSLLFALAWTVLWLIPNGTLRNAPQRLFFGLVIGAGAAGIWVALYPEVLGGPMGQIDPLVRTEVSPHTAEYRSAISSFNLFIQSNYVGLLGLAAISALFWRDRRNPSRLPWLILAAMIMPLIYLGIAHIRFSPYTWVVAAFPIAAFVEVLQQWLNARRSRFADYLRVVAILVCAAVPVLIGFVPDAESEANLVTDPAKKCSIFAVRKALNNVAWFGKPSGILAVDSNGAPAMLYWTRHGTLFGPYHRNAQGLRDLIELFGDEGDEKARAIVRARGIDAVLICARSVEARPSSTLYRRLVEERAPDWLRLKPWPEGIRSGYLLYMVDRERLAAPM
jgi:hypothetical protein